MKQILTKVLILFLVVSSIGLSGCFFNNSETNTITALANNPNYGTVYGTGDYTKGEEITLVAVAKEGYEFVSWGQGSLETNISKTILVEGDASYMAYFQAITEEPVYTLQSVELSATNFAGNVLDVDVALYRLYININNSQILKYQTSSTTNYDYMLQFGLYDQILYSLNNVENRFEDLSSSSELILNIDDFRFSYLNGEFINTEVVLDQNLSLSLEQNNDLYISTATLYEDQGLDLKITLTFNFELL